MATTASARASADPAEGDGDAPLRELIAEHLGPAVRIRDLRPAGAFGAPVFVADYDRGPLHYRSLGSFGPVGAPQSTFDRVIGLSVMDLIYPERLEFPYERLLSLAFALCRRPAAALLLGVGGAAMWRFIGAHLPDCATTLVDSDPDIIAIARRWFYLTQPVENVPADRFVAGADGNFDAILVDLYDGGGPAEMPSEFWGDCLGALSPGGCLATNWADFGTGRVRPMAEAQAAAARARGLSCFFITGPGAGGNTVQYAAADGQGPESVPAALDAFVADRNLPAEMRGMLTDCVITQNFPEPA